MEQVLSELIAELNQRQNSRTDVVSVEWSAVLREQQLMLKTDCGTYHLTEHAHSQVSQTLDIPKRYYDRLRSTNPELLLRNINCTPGKPLMLRIINDKINAVLSDRYQIIDHYDVLMCALETIKNKHHNGAKVTSCEITDTAMHLAITKPEHHFRITTDAEVTPGIMIRNSEFGEGALRVDMYLTFSEGHNMILDLPNRRTHKGKKIEPGVIKHGQRDGPIWNTITDMIDYAFSPVSLNTRISMIRSNTTRIAEKPLDTVDRVCEDHQLTEQQKTTILNHFMELGDRTKYALANAVAITASDTEDQDTTIALECIAGKIAADPPSILRVPLT